MKIYHDSDVWALYMIFIFLMQHNFNMITYDTFTKNTFSSVNVCFSPCFYSGHQQNMVIARGLSDHGPLVPMVTMSISGHANCVDIVCIDTYKGFFPCHILL